MKNGTSGRSEYRFDARSQNFFESEGYLVIRNALTSEQVTELNQAIDLVYEQQKAEENRVKRLQTNDNQHQRAYEKIHALLLR